jgi:type 1 glutamine amidotransferase
VGGYFQSHPEIQTATIDVVDKDHPSTQHLPEKWERKDEWYNYKNLNPEVIVLATLDEESYEGGENGDHHPIAWYHKYDGGRAFYTGSGHTQESYKEPAFLEHIVQGIIWATGNKTESD